MKLLKNNLMKFLVNSELSKDFMFKTKDQIYLEELLLTSKLLNPHNKLLMNLQEISQLGIVKWNLILLEIKIIRIQEMVDKQEPFMLEILTGESKNGN